MHANIILLRISEFNSARRMGLECRLELEIPMFNFKEVLVCKVSEPSIDAITIILLCAFPKVC